MLSLQFGWEIDFSIGLCGERWNCFRILSDFTFKVLAFQKCIFNDLVPTTKLFYKTLKLVVAFFSKPFSTNNVFFLIFFLGYKINNNDTYVILFVFYTNNALIGSPWSFSFRNIVQCPWNCKRLPSHTGQEQACSRITWLVGGSVGCHHAENGWIYRQIAVDAAQYTIVQSTTAHHSPIQPCKAQYSPVQPSTAHHSPLQPSTAQYSPVQPSTAQYSPEQPSSSKFSPVHPSSAQYNQLQYTTTKYSPVHPSTVH